MRLGDLDALKEKINSFYDSLFVGCVSSDLITFATGVDGIIDNAPTYNQMGHRMATAEGFITNPEWNKGELLDCNNCEDKALSYSMGFQDGYLLGGFQLTELRRWLTSQGYSEGTVDDKINEFTRFVEKIRGEEECMTNACYKKQNAKHCNTCLHYSQLTNLQELGYCETKNYHVSANSDKCINYTEKQ